MNCTFFGHRDSSSDVKILLKEAILNLIKKESIDRFIVGNNGSFDLYVQEILADLKKENTKISFNIVLSKIDEKALSGNQEETLYPDGLEKSIPKFAISKRNEWLIKNSSFLIAFVKHNFSNSSKWLKKAEKRGIKIINLAEQTTNYK